MPTSKDVAQPETSPGMVASAALQAALFGPFGSVSQMQPVTPAAPEQAILAAVTALETRIVALGG